MNTSTTYDLFGQAEHLDALFADEADFFAKYDPSEEELDRLVAIDMRRIDRVIGALIVATGFASMAVITFIAAMLAPDMWQFHRFT